MEYFFDHERLKVYQEAIAFVAWWQELRDKCRGSGGVVDQIDRASASIALNIAEGNGKYSARDRRRFLEIASSSALECAACLDVLVARKRLQIEETQSGKRRLQGIVSMLIGWMNQLSSRVSEEVPPYDVIADTERSSA